MVSVYIQHTSQRSCALLHISTHIRSRWDALYFKKSLTCETGINDKYVRTELNRTLHTRSGFWEHNNIPRLGDATLPAVEETYVLSGSLLSETHQMLLSCLSLLVFCRMSVLLLLLKWLLCLRPGVPQSRWLGREWCSSSPLSGWRRYTPSITPPQTRPGRGLSGGMPQHAHTIGTHHIDTHTP